MVKIEEWSPKPSEVIARPIGDKIISMPLSEYSNGELPAWSNHFSIKKKLSYQNIKEDICHHINYFIANFDKKGILIPGYMKVKMLTDITSIKGIAFPIEEFVTTLMEFIINPIIPSIDKLVDLNFIPLTSSGFKGDDGLKFTDEHSKAFMKAAIIIKLIIPATIHYIEKNEKFGLDVENILDVFYPICLLYKDVVNIPSKIYNTVKVRVNNNRYQNKKVWELYTIQGTLPDVYVDELTNDIILGSLPKLKFCEEGSVVAFIHSVIHKQMYHKNIGSTIFNGRKVNPNIYSGDDSLSELDKLEINMQMEDESKLTLQNLSVTRLIETLEDEYGAITDEEFDFYMNNSSSETFQREIVLNLLAKHVGTNRLSLNNITYIKLMILMRKYLLSLGYIYLPEIISSKAIKSNRRNLSKKLEEKIEDDKKFKYIMEKYMHNEKVKEKIITVNLGLLTANINKFRIVNFDRPDRLDTKLPALKPILIDEYLRYLMIV